MLDFSKLRLSSFKSFVEPVEIDIKDGLTGVVGPNGCGKSNLVEAIRWVMGEASFKSMRASNMEGVIFQGTQNRPSRNSAEVSLVLNNKDRDAPLICNDAEIIEVTRRIEREAGSAYKLNGNDIRARDIQMLFADASTGARSPSLVRQGQIQELIDQKPNERRRILEDAAGISGLHVRRHEAELRIKSAELNIDRLDDILKELSSQIRSLNKQSREAKRYKNLSQKIRESEILLLAKNYITFEMLCNENESKLNSLNVEYQNIVRDISTKKTEELNAQNTLPNLKENANSSSAELQRLIIQMERFDNDKEQSERRKQELEDLIMTTNQQLIREEQILEDINYSAFDNSKNNNDEDELKIKINKKEKLIFNIEKDINQLTELYADKNALESLIGDSIETSNSLIEGLEVTPGYEKALDALLGDELYYSLDSANDIYWKKNSIKGNVQSLPKDTQSLSDFVNGSDILNQRLSQTALVSKEKGDMLFSELSYGQRMVTKEGDLWRWDGLVVSAGAPGSAAERLGHRNHLIEIYDSIKNFEKNNGNMEHLRDQLKIEHKNLSDLKLNFEKYQLDKKNISEIEKRSDLAKDQISILKERIKKFEEENNDLDQKPEDVELRKTELNEKISSARKNNNEDSDNLANLENRLRDLVNEIRTLSDKESLLREKKGRIEVTLEANKIRLSELTDLIKKEHKEISVFMDEISVSLNDLNENEIQISIDKLKIERDQLGGVNLKAEDEAKEIKERIDDIKIERNDLVEAIKKLKVGINDLNKEGRERMQRAFFEVNEEFQNVFKKFFGGGNAELKFIDSDDPLEAGLEVFAQLPGKKLIEMSSLSGGEKGLVSLSLIFAVFLTNPSPICVLDEVDAALDDSNVEKFCDLVEEISSNVKTRFLVITHHPLTMARMDRLYGVTMQEKGVSQLVSVDLNVAEKIRNIA
tara:strand:+ start:86 stop:2884 length:2799 start_codon:yes stop_codon:yes gene_type:complete